MLRAFPTTLHLVIWIASLIAILVTPLVTSAVVGPQTRYLVMSKRVGPTNWYANQILRKREPLDIVFLGSSRILSAIDHAALQRQMAAAGAHPATATLAADFNANDLTYTFLKDFFAHRKARLVVIAYPDPEFPETDSNPAEKYIRSVDPRDPALDVGRPGLAASSYAEMALIGSRLLVASVIPPGPIVKGQYNFMSDAAALEDTRGTMAPDWGYSKSKVGGTRAPFVKSVLWDPPQPAIVIRPNAPLPPEVALTDAPLTPLEAAYLPAIKALCERNGAVLALLKQPFAEHQDPRVIAVSRQVVALGIPIIATSRQRMYGEATVDQIRTQYYNYFHQNSNGARRAAQAYAPALGELLGQRGPQ
jgi:hypothetical protein